MFKIVLPYSVYALALALIIGAPVWLAALLGGLVEFTGATLLLIQLTGVQQFKYYSFYGHIIRQFTTVEVISLRTISFLVGVRLLSFLFIGMGLWYVGLPFYVLSASHWVRTVD